MAERRFRVQQLQQLSEAAPDAETDPARREIHLALRAAARTALRDIDAALRKSGKAATGAAPDAATHCPWSGSVPCR